VVRPCYIGVDLGTSGCRAVAIDQARNIVAEERTDLPEPVRDAAGGGSNRTPGCGGMPSSASCAG